MHIFTAGMLNQQNKTKKADEPQERCYMVLLMPTSGGNEFCD